MNTFLTPTWFAKELRVILHQVAPTLRLPTKVSVYGMEATARLRGDSRKKVFELQLDDPHLLVASPDVADQHLRQIVSERLRPAMEAGARD